MSYRDDHDALLARLEGVLQENARLRERITELENPRPAPAASTSDRTPLIGCPTCGRPVTFLCSTCSDCGGELRARPRHTMRGHAPVPFAPAPDHFLRNLLIGGSIAGATLGFFLAIKFLVLTGAG